MLVIHSPQHEITQLNTIYFRAMGDLAAYNAMEVLDAVVTAAALSFREHEIAQHASKHAPLHRRWTARRQAKQHQKVWQERYQIVAFALNHLLSAKGMSYQQARVRARRLIKLRCQELDLSAQIPAHHHNI
ncbi:hypothetical protein [Nonomuraea jabiensis]|uniref:hypothetical protein n=1 Tax=Nonomuraea jabiensis TaxID=882448 RepID=UPI003D753832